MRHQVFRGRDRLDASALDDQPGDLRRVGLVAEFEKRLRQLMLAHAIDERRGRLPAGGIHAHVERSGPAIGKPALRVVDLRAGDADVGENGIHL